MDIVKISVVNNFVEPPQKFFTKLVVENCEIRFEVDTGAYFTLLSKQKYLEFQFFDKMQPISRKLQTYDKGFVDVIGTVNVRVCYNGKMHDFNLQIVDGDYDSVLGCDWLIPMKFDFREFIPTDNVNMLDSSLKLKIESLVNNYADLFAEEPGCIPNCKAEIHVDSGKPNFLS